MLIDSRELSDESRIETDVCVIGGGPAGITVARELAELGIDAVILESGGTTPDLATQDLYRGFLAGKDYGALDSVRLRYLGGSSNHWTGYVRVLRPADFEKKDWIPSSGWPITESDMRPYYLRAKKVFDLGSSNLDGDYWATTLDQPFIDFDQNKVRHGVSILRPKRFGDKIENEFLTARNLRVYLHANVTRIQASLDGTSIDSVRVQTLTGLTIRATARYYVLACGGIENARIMLASNDIVSKGVGNSNDVVGRYFMEHLYSADAGIVFSDYEAAQRLSAVYGSRHHVGDDLEILPHIEISDRRKAAEKTRGLLVKIRRVPRPVKGVRALREMLSGMRSRSSAKAILSNLGKAILNIDDISIMASDRLSGAIPGNTLVATAEQSPNAQSRVLLHATERDALEMPRAVLDWRVHKEDYESIQAGIQTIGAEFGRLNVGRIQSNFLSGDESWREKLYWAYHHLGTTRMGVSPRESVVNQDCRVHDKSNLYVAGSSVFPTGGTATPTFLIVALAIRIADTIATQMQKAGAR